MRYYFNHLLSALLIFTISNHVQMVNAQTVDVYSTNFDSLNPGLALTGQDGWKTNDPKGPGEPAGESDGLTRLVLPDGATSRAAYIGGPYRAAYPPGRTNVMLWPEINGIGATLKFTVSILIQPSDSNGIYSESDTFAWTFLDDTHNPMFSIAFEPTDNDPESRKITVLNENGAKVNLEEQHLINIRQLYELEVLMVPNGEHVSVSANLSNAISEINFAILNLPACSTNRVIGVAANWIMTDAKVHGNGIVTGFGSNYMAFDNYALSTDNSVYVGIEDETVSESDQFVNILATICDPIDEDVVIKYKTVDGSAIAGLDYENSEAVLIIPAGQVSANLKVPIMDDSSNEENEFFSVRFSTEDQKIKFIDSEITVTIENSYTNLKPVIADQTFEVQENASKDRIIRVIVATDPNEDTLSFSITSNADPNENGTQALRIVDNQLLVNDSGDLDFEEQSALQVTITVSDGELTDQATITVNLNDDREEDADGDGLTEAQEEDIYGTSDTNVDTDGDGYADGAEVTAQVDPADPNSFPNEAPVIADQSFSVEENTANGTIVGTIATTDANQDTLICTITENKDPDQDGNEALRVEGNKLLVNDSDDLDFEKQSALQVTITVSDGELTDQAIITVNLNDDREEDADGDGLTEAQEEDIYGTSDTNVDTDGDGYADDCEILFRSSPNNAKNVPAFKIKMNVLEGNRLELLFPGEKRTLYSVQTSDDMKIWLSLEKLIIGQGGTVQEIFSISRANSGYYWRVRKE
jgi:hypothetical protein